VKIVTIFGVSKSGKTTTIEALISELLSRGYTVGSIKDIHYEQFVIDTPGSNTDRHTRAGANPVTAWGINETDVLYNRRLPLRELLKFYTQDYVILEGSREPGIPAILTAHRTEELEELDTPDVFVISGRIAALISQYKGRPAINAVTDIAALTDLVEEKAKECDEL